MAFNINDFVSELNYKGTSKSSHFQVMIFGPNIDNESSVERSITMRCKSIDLPGRMAQTTNASNYGMERKVATLPLFTEVGVQIIASDTHSEREYFEKWMDKIMGPFRNGKVGPNMYDVGFYEDYIGTVNIVQFDDTGAIVHETELVEAYPIDIGQETLDWDSTQLILLPVRFTFKYYVNKKH